MSSSRYLVHTGCVAVSFISLAAVLFIAHGQEFGSPSLYAELAALAVNMIVFSHIGLFLARRGWCPPESGRFLTVVSIGFGYICLATVLYLVCSEHFAIRH